MRIFGLIAISALLITCVSANADSFGSAVGGVPANQSSLGGGLCLTSPSVISNGQQRALLVDCSTGALITEPSGSGPATAVTTTPALRIIVPLDVSSVATGGTAVTALTAGHRTAGGFLFNPIGATISLCINEQSTASGTTSAGATTCIQPGQSYTLTPAAGAVSVITSDSSHPFSGQGLQ